MSRGGARPGAGRPAQRPKVEHCRTLDVRVLFRRGMLQPGAWDRVWRDEPIHRASASLHLKSTGDRLGLQYQEAGRSAYADVPIVQTRCHFGGARAWFLCPGCEHRVALLYLHPFRIACRRCLGLSYRSQRSALCRRSWLKQRKLEALLGPGGARPDRMHMKTYLRVLQAIRRCQLTRELWLAGALGPVLIELEALRASMR